ncbi:M23 family metallopeptidase [Rhodococcoides corynebacterioides]|uniref:M23 family metallopeptidase n=1 Tax=Rhodococcoides corynebacterioides TaxID=53972 RepID=A0ABS7NZH1_9NOCA|nr:M23 family metallopeptidase [Rhodococcus corynebacterioides]MBY6365465.1 M23 family metallopeptidase [Rhodococcus corynebacterioides]MBY6407881.1 M23 family metallopeptidase [Rhodococcus corynebacterioides]
MQHHRTPFTPSRFVGDSSTDTTGITGIPDPSPVDTSSPWDRDHEADDYDATVPAWSATTPADDAPRRRRSVPATQFLIATTDPDTVDEVAPRRSGAHRIPAPPSALKGRVAVVAVAAGAVVSAGQAAVTGHQSAERTDVSEYALAAGQAPAAAASAGVDDAAAPAVLDVAAPTSDTLPTATSTGAPISAPSKSAAPQILNVTSPIDLGQFDELLAKGQRFLAEREAREAAARRPLFVLPALGTYTSGFGARWGTLHAGVDIANAIGTPVRAVADGTVIDSGPAAGFGLWIRLQHADGTITVYGHIDSSEVQVGQTVMAGDEIAKMGNRGQSTGPHLHFEVHLPGENKIDPLPWLATRGISLGPAGD